MPRDPVKILDRVMRVSLLVALAALIVSLIAHGVLHLNADGSAGSALFLACKQAVRPCISGGSWWRLGQS
jgi:hypothetical protein